MVDFQHCNLLGLCFLVICMVDGTDGRGVLSNGEKPTALESLLVEEVEDSNELSFFYDLDRHLLKTEYDILLTMEEYEELISPDSRKKRAAGVYPSQKEKRWTNNTVNYEFDSTYEERDKDVVVGALVEWSHFTCLKFERNQNKNRILLQHDHGCYSRIGMARGVQPIALSMNCRNRQIVLHEFGHALGLHHEQTRPDRDDYVIIHTENIHDGMEFNFQKYSWNYIMDLGVPYDYTSIMHYSNEAFSHNGQISIETKDPKYRDVIGTTDSLSFWDIKTVNLMYNCGAENACSKKDRECPGEGFVGKDCTCWCPGGTDNVVVKHCDPNDDLIKGSLELTCVDRYPYKCILYEGLGYCSEKHPYARYTRINCPRSCHVC